jgi:hypothetical protein
LIGVSYTGLVLCSDTLVQYWFLDDAYMREWELNGVCIPGDKGQLCWSLLGSHDREDDHLILIVLSLQWLLLSQQDLLWNLVTNNDFGRREGHGLYFYDLVYVVVIVIHGCHGESIPPLSLRRWFHDDLDFNVLLFRITRMGCLVNYYSSWDLNGIMRQNNCTFLSRLDDRFRLFRRYLDGFDHDDHLFSVVIERLVRATPVRLEGLSFASAIAQINDESALH